MNHSGQMMTMDTRGIVATSRGSKESIFSTNRGRIIILLLLICIPLISYWEDIVIIFVQPPTQNNGIKSSQQSQDAFNSYKLNTPLFEAVKSDDIELVRKLLNDGENTDNNNNNNGGKVVYYNVNAEDPKGLTPLIEATLIGNVDLVKLLLLHGAKAQPLPGFRHTPLRAACLTGNTELITLLIEQGADPNAKTDIDSKGRGNRTAAGMAKFGNHASTLKIIEDAMNNGELHLSVSKNELLKVSKE